MANDSRPVLVNPDVPTIGSAAGADQLTAPSTRKDATKRLELAKTMRNVLRDGAANGMSMVHEAGPQVPLRLSAPSSVGDR